MNYRLALEWYDKSISQGIEAANTRKSNFIACTIQWNMDAMSGDADALYRLGLLARDGACEVQDIDKAAELFKMATEAGSIEAKEELQKLDYAFVEELGDEDISKRSDDNFEKGMGSYNMGVCYAQGLGVPQDMTKAVEWWRKAVEQESDANAMFRLGVCYWNGDGGLYNTGRLGAQGLYNISTPVSNPQPGDLVFFTGTYDTPGVSHVGIYVGEDGDGSPVMLHCGDPIQYSKLDTSYWQSHFYAYGRLNYN